MSIIKKTAKTDDREPASDYYVYRSGKSPKDMTDYIFNLILPHESEIIRPDESAWQTITQNVIKQIAED